VRVRLTREQRRALYDGTYPKISGEGDCPWPMGKAHYLSSRFWIKPVATHTQLVPGKAHHWRLEYEVYDHRDRYLDSGGPSPMGEAEREKRSSSNDAERGYTGNPHTRLADAGAAVSREVQKQQTSESKRRWSLYESEERAVEIAEKQQRAINNKIRRLMKDGAKTGVDITPHLAKALEAAEAEVAAARKAA
jgi:hypothetical protein